MIVEISLIHIILGVIGVAVVFTIFGLFMGCALGISGNASRKEEEMVWTASLDKKTGGD